ncbi:uncharacterized protein N7483_007735 [Penicillium malachiteum]|uniref:uncharacterized protein n=1 Tax=Penicillium malachiteum TaxID=1324776 RepID=UPI002548FFBC|nr:uncharacterized protein N7483_007735 [Penicillium malachiteum]KAJ5726378.1 hypothetical protein N7483_007735 [Penicillium malachiteum]
MIPRHSHKRSLSSEHRALSPEKTVTKAKSTTDLTENIGKNAPTSHINRFEEDGFNTLQDPRLAAQTEASPSISSTHHPDLSNEVAALSVKLIQAINNQAQLDDSLVATRQELELAQGKIQALEFQNEKYRRDLDTKVYIKKSDADREILQLRTALAEERAQRAVVEKGKKTIEQELETLTADLFEEANKMVAAAKIEREVVEKKNEQLRSQVRDTESLLASHQDQLAELKSVMQGMHLSKDDMDSRAASTAPPSPAGASQTQGPTKHNPESHHLVANPCNPEGRTPGPSCDFPEILRMVCRTDLQSFDDFRELLTLSRGSKPPSRAGSGSYAGLNVMSLAGFGSGAASANNSPTKGVTSSPNGSLSSQFGSHAPLKDTRFYKRVLMEDIEPTLRLDLAPGISWLTRRTVLSGICEGTLVVEPMPAMTKKYEFPCTVCGERRPGPQNERTHRFRTSESETAQRYSLCLQCVERIRSCCEFTGYLRLILDGHLKAGDVEEEREIWEETVRLRERMFWSRVAGGIIPLVIRAPEPDVEININTLDTESSVYTPGGGYLHPTDNSVINECKIHEMTASIEPTQIKRDSSVFAPSLPDFEMAQPATPDSPTFEGKDLQNSASDSLQRRASVDSDMSVYEEAEEANATVETEYVGSEVEQDPYTPDPSSHSIS